MEAPGVFRSDDVSGREQLDQSRRGIADIAQGRCREHDFPLRLLRENGFTLIGHSRIVSVRHTRAPPTMGG